MQQKLAGVIEGRRESPGEQQVPELGWVCGSARYWCSVNHVQLVPAPVMALQGSRPSRSIYHLTFGRQKSSPTLHSMN